MKKTLNLIGSILGTVGAGIYSIMGVMGIAYIFALFTEPALIFAALISLVLLALGIVTLVFNIIAIVKSAKNSSFKLTLTVVLNFVFAGLILINGILGAFSTLAIVEMLLAVAAGVLMIVAKNK